MVGTELFRYLLGDAPVAESAAYGVEPEPGDVNLAGLALVMLVLCAPSSGPLLTRLAGVSPRPRGPRPATKDGGGATHP